MFFERPQGVEFFLLKHNIYIISVAPTFKLLNLLSVCYLKQEKEKRSEQAEWLGFLLRATMSLLKGPDGNVTLCSVACQRCDGCEDLLSLVTTIPDAVLCL